MLFVCPSISILVLTMDTLTVCNSIGAGGGGPNISVGNKFFILVLKNKFRGSIFIEKLVPGEQILGGNKFVMTVQSL